MIFIYITCRDKKEAKKIGLDLVKKRLAACCNMFPIESIYWWKNKIVKDKPRTNSSRIIRGREAVLIVKTLKKNFNKIKKEIKKLRNCAAPCILEIPIKRVNLEYLNWLKKEIK